MSTESDVTMQESRGESILLAGADPSRVLTWTNVVQAAGHEVRSAGDPAAVLELYAEQPPSVVICDGEMAQHNGRQLVPHLRSLDARAVIVVVCDEPDVEEAVELMKEGVFHVLSRPVTHEQLLLVVSKALEHGRLHRGNRDLRDRLDLTERLAMIGRLASGVAHELNNPLDAVRRYVALAQDGLGDAAPDVVECLEHATSGLSRMAGIVRQLLTFSRNVVRENSRENLGTMLEEVVRTLAPTGSGGAMVNVVNPYIDLGAPRALFQVFSNLLRNALDAVESQGPRGRVSIRVMREDDDVVVSVQDNGAGIPEEDRLRVFEPFYTTKEVGKGTGLGLPISARIVERCGGTLHIESEVGTGTRVVVCLPAEAPAGHAPRVLEGAEA